MSFRESFWPRSVNTKAVGPRDGLCNSALCAPVCFLLREVHFRFRSSITQLSLKTASKAFVSVFSSPVDSDHLLMFPMRRKSCAVGGNSISGMVCELFKFISAILDYTSSSSIFRFLTEMKNVIGLAIYFGGTRPPGKFDRFFIPYLGFSEFSPWNFPFGFGFSRETWPQKMVIPFSSGKVLSSSPQFREIHNWEPFSSAAVLGGLLATGRSADFPR